MLGDREYGIDPLASVTVAEQIKQIYTILPTFLTFA